MKKTIKKMRGWGCLFVGAVCLAGCVSKPSTFVRYKPLNINGNVRMAIIPFSNLSSERDADKKVTYALITYILKSSYFDVVAMGETQKAMRDVKAREGEDLSLEQITEIGKMTGADVLFMGVVDEYKIDSSTEMGEKVFIPEVSIYVRLVSARTGDIVWSSNHHRRGDQQVSVFGMGRVDSISTLTDIIIKDTFRALSEALNEKQEVLAALKIGHRPPPAPSGEAPSDERMEEARREIEHLKKEKAALNDELAALKKKLEGPAAGPSQKPVEAAPTPSTPPLEVKPPDEREAARAEFGKAKEKISKQYLEPVSMGKNEAVKPAI